jgi:P-type conjugative transfer protein TrbG
MRSPQRQLYAIARMVLAFLVLSTTMAIGQIDQNAAPPDGSIRFTFGHRPTPHLTCQPQHVCDIALDSSGETIIDLEIGNSNHWSVAQGHSGTGEWTPHIFVRPTQAGLDTNLVITTTKRTYNISLRSAQTFDEASISFSYPLSSADRSTIAKQQHQAIAFVLNGNPAVGPERLDTAYTISGDSAAAPAKVFNDGSRTYIQWMALPPALPNVVLPTRTAKTSFIPMVNFRVVGSTYIVDELGTNYDLVWNLHARNEKRVSVHHA